jgi:hypothetical protein
MTDAESAHAATSDHGDGDGHATAGEPLGPVDRQAWAYAIGGSLLGAIVVLALFIARGS